MGHSPPLGAKANDPSFNDQASAQYLAELSGLKGPDELDTHFVRLYLLAVSGVQISTLSPKRRSAAGLLILAHLYHQFGHVPRLLLCGSLVAGAFGVQGKPYRWHAMTWSFEDGVHDRGLVGIIHTPSPRNRWFKDSKHRDRTAKFLRDVIADQTEEAKDD